MRAPSLRRALVTLATLLAASCGGRTDTPPNQTATAASTCVSTTDCGAGTVCLFRTCVAQCTADRDCAAGARCLRTANGYGCVTADAATCAAACPAGTTCGAADQTCRASCADGAGCLGDQTCDGQVCVGHDGAHDPAATSAEGAGGHGQSGGGGQSSAGAHGGAPTSVGGAAAVGVGGSGAAGSAATGAGGDAQGAGGSSPAQGGGWPAVSGPCYPTDPACGLPGSSCMARVDQTASTTKTFRVSQLQVSAPPKLATKIFEYTIIRAGVDLPLPQCNYLDGANGTLSWFLSFDQESGVLTTGSAPVVSDAAAPSCLLDRTYGTATVAPVKSPFVDTAGVLSVAPIPQVFIAIFTQNPPVNDPIVLPLSQLAITGITLGEGGDCIGRFKGFSGELDDSTCQPTTTDTSMGTSFQWQNGGHMTGYLRLAAADAIPIAVLGGASLCTVLASADPNDSHHCPRDANGVVTAKGDTSSLEHPGSLDSVAFAADFAASSALLGGICP